MYEPLPASADIYLRVLRMTGIEGLAARAARVTRREVRDMCQRDTSFAEAVESALEDAVDDLERVARDRALHGTMRGIYHRGQLVGTRTEYDDALLLALLRAKRRQFRQRREVQVKTAPVEIRVRTFSTA
jgi:hypothetical protein